MDLYQLLGCESMPSQESLDKLSEQGIYMLHENKLAYPFYVLQITGLLCKSEDNYTVYLSDGFCFIRGRLEDAAAIKAASKQISKLCVVKIRSEDILMLLDDEDIDFTLKDLTRVDLPVRRVLGIPLPYRDYICNNNMNEKGDNLIKNGCKLPTISQIRQTVAKRCSLLAKVITKPNKVFEVMNVIVEDENGDRIQLVFFGVVVINFFATLRVGMWYTFQNVILQQNNITFKQEIKITNQSIIKFYKSDKAEEANNEQSKQRECPAPPTSPPIAFVEFDQDLYKNDKNYNWNHNTILTAIVTKVAPFQKFGGRAVEVLDLKMLPIEIILWKQCDHLQVAVGETYVFSMLRPKIYKVKLSLHSQHEQTKIVPSKIKIRCDVLQHRNYKKYRNEKLHSVQQMLKEQNIKQNNGKLYFNVLGYLLIHPDTFKYNKLQGRNKFFCVFCKRCEYRSGTMEVNFEENAITCSLCQNQVQVLWNIRVKFFDKHKAVMARLNNDLVIKMLNVQPQQGLNLYMFNMQQFRRLMNKLSFKRNIYKVHVKPKNETEKYYNICDVYETPSTLILAVSMNNFKKALAKYTKKGGKLSLLSLFWKKEIAKIKLKSKNSKNQQEKIQERRQEDEQEDHSDNENMQPRPIKIDSNYSKQARQ